MLGIQRAAELSTALFHIGGLSGAATHLAHGDAVGALGIAVIATLCVLLITGAVVLAEIARVKTRQYARKHAEPSEPRDKGESDA